MICNYFFNNNVHRKHQDLHVKIQVVIYIHLNATVGAGHWLSTTVFVTQHYIHFMLDFMNEE